MANKPDMESVVPGGALILSSALDAIRARPWLYVVSADWRGIAQLVEYVVAFAFRDGGVWAQSSDVVSVDVLDGGGFRVSDDGVGISAQPDECGVVPLSRVFSSIPAGVDTGTLAVVTALSRRLVVVTNSGGMAWRQEFGDGDDSRIECLGPSVCTGTVVDFWPSDVFRGDLSNDALLDWLHGFIERRGGLSFQDRAGLGIAPHIVIRRTVEG